MKKLYKEYPVTAGGGTITLKANAINDYYLINGDDVTLTSNLTITIDEASKNNVIKIYWLQDVTLNGNTITILGKSITRATLSDAIIKAAYDGTDWNVWIVDDVDLTGLQSSPVASEGYIQISDGKGGFTSVPNYRMGMTTGFILGDNPDIEAASFVVGASNTADVPVRILGSNNTFSTGKSGRVMGDSNDISGDNSFTIGSGLKNNSYKEIVVGYYNTDVTALSATTWSSNDKLFSIGNGTSDKNRKDALVIYKNGKAQLQNILNLTPLEELPAVEDSEMGDICVIDNLYNGTLWFFDGIAWGEITVVIP